MTTSVPSITPQTAPRDPEGLKKAGIFQLRTLTERLGGLNSEEQRMAYARLNIDQKVDLALQLLQQFDRANPGAAQMQAPPPHVNGQTNGAPAMAPPPMMASTSMPFNGAPVAQLPNGQPMQPAFGGFPQAQQQQYARQPPMMSQQPLPMGPPQVSMVDPGALAAAQAAASATTTATGRQPRNKATTKEDGPDLGEKVLNALTSLAQMVQANTEAAAGAIKEVTGAIDELRKDSPKEQLKGLHESYRGVYQVLSQWDGRITQLQNSTNLAIALSLMLGEQVMGAPRDQILQAAAADMGSISALISGAPGKG